MKQVQHTLLAHFIAWVALALCIVIVFENNWLPTGVLADDKTSDFVVATLMELLTICVIPFALWMFRYKRIHNQLVERKETALRKWGLIRMYLLVIPMTANTIIYYLYMNVAFGYMGIILFLSLFFIYPSLARCNQEVN